MELHITPVMGFIGDDNRLLVNCGKCGHQSTWKLHQHYYDLRVDAIAREFKVIVRRGAHQSPWRATASFEEVSAQAALMGHPLPPDLLNDSAFLEDDRYALIISTAVGSLFQDLLQAMSVPTSPKETAAAAGSKAAKLGSWLSKRRYQCSCSCGCRVTRTFPGSTLAPHIMSYKRQQVYRLLILLYVLGQSYREIQAFCESAPIPLRGLPKSTIHRYIFKNIANSPIFRELHDVNRHRIKIMLVSDSIYYLQNGPQLASDSTFAQARFELAQSLLAPDETPLSGPSDRYVDWHLRVSIPYNATHQPVIEWLMLWCQKADLRVYPLGTQHPSRDYATSIVLPDTSEVIPVAEQWRRERWGLAPRQLSWEQGNCREAKSNTRSNTTYVDRLGQLEHAPPTWKPLSITAFERPTAEFTSFTPGKSLRDFWCCVKATVTSFVGPHVTWGIVFGEHDNPWLHWSDCWIVNIEPIEQRFCVVYLRRFATDPDKWSFSVPWAKSHAIQSVGVPNEVIVRCRGDETVIQINDSVVAGIRTEERTLPPLGEVGFFTSVVDGVLCEQAELLVPVRRKYNTMHH